MKSDSSGKFVLPIEFVLSMTLIGMLLLSAVLYYRSVKFQRFMEPLLAISRSKIKFTQNINRLLLERFGDNKIKGIMFTTDSIVVDESIFHVVDYQGEVYGPLALKKLGHILLSILRDEEMMLDIDYILVNRNFPYSDDKELNRQMSVQMQQKSESALKSLYKAVPELEEEFGVFFTATAVPERVFQSKFTSVEIRFISSEQAHVGIIQELGKYLY